jgi:hypothetical protein
MLIRRREWQNVSIGKLVGMAVCLSLTGLPAQAQTGGSSPSSGGSQGGGGGFGGSSGGSSSGTGSSSMNSLGGSGTSGSSSGLSNTSGNGLAGSTNSLTNASSTLSNTGLSGTATNYTPAPAGSIGPSKTNIIGPYYKSPLAAGLPNSVIGSSTGGSGSGQTARFGQPLYVPANTNLNSSGGGGGGRGSGGGLGGGTGAQSTAAVGMSVGPRFTQTLGWRTAAPASGGARLQTDLQRVIANTPSLVSARNIQVAMEGQTVVLKGTAADDHERALAAAVISMSPGVYGVRNDLKVPSVGSGPAVATPSVRAPAANRQP